MMEKSAAFVGAALHGRADKPGLEALAARFRFPLALGLLGASILLGGRSAGALWAESVIQILAAWLLALLILSPRIESRSRLVPAALTLILSLLLLFLLQMLPLPAAYWAGLPGRDFSQAVTAAIGEAEGARPLTLNASGTVQAALTLLAPIALFFAVLGMTAAQRRLMLWVIFALAFASAILGLVQFSSRGAIGDLFGSTHRIYALGFFSDRNHTADLAIIGLLVGCYLFPEGRRDLPAWASRAGFALACLVLAIALIGTQSRFGVGAGACLSFVGAALMLPQRRARTIILGGLALLFALTTMILIFRGDLADSLLSRFQSVGDDARGAIWPDVLWAVQYFFPAGSGFGSFQQIFPIAESLGDVTPRYINHAHNDYLEIALEGGLMALLLLLGFFLWYGAALWAGLRKAASREQKRLTLMAGGGTALLLAHSLVEYPLRTSALAALFAVLLALLVPAAHHPARADKRRASRE